jgi:hypothetical protein
MSVKAEEAHIVRSGPRTASSLASDSGAVGLTARSFPRTWNRIGKVRFCMRSMQLSWFVDVVTTVGSSSILPEEHGHASARWSPLPRDSERAPNTFRL